MKKQLLAIAVLTAGIMNAQTWSENFSSSTPPAIPSTWSQNNVDALTTYSALSSFSFAANAWVTHDYTASTNTVVSSHGKIIASTSYYTPAGTSNDWLITPSFTVPTNGVIAWEAMASSANYPDGYLVKISTTGTATTNFTTLLTVPAENPTWNSRSINLNAYAGQVIYIAFVNNSNDMELLFLDNITCLVPASNDIKITSAAPTGLNIWGTIGSNKTITGTITNNGYTPITSFTAKYSDGIVNANSVFSGLNLAYAQTYSFSIATPYSITSATESKLKVWTELTGDATHTNDTLVTYPKGYSFSPNHKVVFEEGTGTWCGWCPRGAVYMDSMNKVNPNTTVLIAAHNSSSDPMTNTVYDAGMGTLVAGYPTALCDRSIDIIDPSDMFTSYASHIGDFGLADITLTPTYNSTTRVANVTITSHIASTFPNNTAANDYRLAVVFTENNVTGTASGYAQHNYYSSASQNQPLTGAGHNWQTEPATIPATSMKYDFVARQIVGGFSGLANSLPSSLVAGTTYTSNVFTYTIPVAYNVGNMKVHALLIDAKNQIIYNAETTTLAPTTGIKTVDALQTEVTVYPNPAKNNATIELNLTKAETITINVLSVMGQVIYTQTLNNVPAGSQKIALNSEAWANGIYNLNISTSNGNVSRKLEIIK